MTIWLGYLLIIFIGGIVMRECKPAWRTAILVLAILSISFIYYVGEKF